MKTLGLLSFVLAFTHHAPCSALSQRPGQKRLTTEIDNPPLCAQDSRNLPCKITTDPPSRRCAEYMCDCIPNIANSNAFRGEETTETQTIAKDCIGTLYEPTPKIKPEEKAQTAMFYLISTKDPIEEADSTPIGQCFSWGGTVGDRRPKRLSTGSIVGIVIGSIIFFGVLALGVLFCLAVWFGGRLCKAFDEHLP